MLGDAISYGKKGVLNFKIMLKNVFVTYIKHILKFIFPVSEITFIAKIYFQPKVRINKSNTSNLNYRFEMSQNTHTQTQHLNHLRKVNK